MINPLSTKPESSRNAFRRHLWIGVSLGVLALISLAVFAIYLFTRNLEIARQSSRDRMANLADYIVDYVTQDFFSYTLILSPENLPPDLVKGKNAWLQKLAKATGLQHVSVTDSLGKIYFASESRFKTGASITQSADSACFESASRGGLPVYCNRSLRSLSLQSLYHPFDFFGSRHLIVLESDINFLAYLEQYRTFIYGVSVFLGIILSGLIAALLVIDKRARQALQLSRRNEQLAFLGRTSAELAHELKNPLAIIKSSVDVLVRQMDPERKNQAFQYLSEEVMRLSRMISNILGLSQDRELDIRPMHPGDAVAAAARAVAEVYPGVRVVQSMETEEKVPGDRDALRQIAENLLRNSGQAMQGRGKCAVIYRLQEGRGVLLFGDEGPGIPPQLRASLFDPFVTGNKAGTGLGLAIVRSLAEKMGWEVSLLPQADAARLFQDEKINTCFRLLSPKDR